MHTSNCCWETSDESEKTKWWNGSAGRAASAERGRVNILDQNWSQEETSCREDRRERVGQRGKVCSEDKAATEGVAEVIDQWFSEGR